MKALAKGQRVEVVRVRGIQHSPFAGRHGSVHRVVYRWPIHDQVLVTLDGDSTPVGLLACEVRPLEAAKSNEREG